MPSAKQNSAREIVLEKVELSAMCAISESVLLDGKVDIIDDFIGRTLRAQIHGFLWGKTIESHHVSYPLNWVEALKERWFPLWAKRRWPVKMNKININLKAIWPTLRFMIPQHTPRLVLTSFGSSLGGYYEATHK